MKVSPARMVRAALPVPLETPAGTDLWVPRATMVVLASQALSALQVTEVHLAKMDVMASKALGADQE